MPDAIQQQINIRVLMTWRTNEACIILYPKLDDKNFPIYCISNAERCCFSFIATCL